MRFLDQALRKFGKRITVDARQRKRIAHVLYGGANERMAALVHQTGIGTEYEDNRFRRIRPGDEAVDIPGLECNHSDDAA